jgi:hypothetical protein
MRGWGSRRDASLRQELQRCQSRIRLDQQSLAAFRECFIPLAMSLPIIDVTELLSYLGRAENPLAGVEGGGR